MGMNAIRCEGYADIKESGFGKGQKSSSDFNGKDILKGVTMMALLAAGTFVAGCAGNDNSAEQPARVERYRFNGFGDTKTIHDEATNKTYAIEFNGLENVAGNNLVFYKTVHFAIYDVGSQGKTKVGDFGVTDNGNGMMLPGTEMTFYADVKDNYVDLKITEQ